MEHIDVTKIMEAFSSHINSNRDLSFLFGAGISIDYVPDIQVITSNIENEIIASNIEKDKAAWEFLKTEANDNTKSFTIEFVFSCLSNKLIAVGKEKLLGLNHSELSDFLERLVLLFNNEICKNIKPDSKGSYNEIIKLSPHLKFAEWLTHRNSTIGCEIFTPNYDYLLELALEFQKIRYYDGFNGGFVPYFDSSSIEDRNYRMPDVKLWKVHGSLGWSAQEGEIIKSREEKNKIMILPSSLKYDETKKLPYSILLDRFASAIRANEGTLIVCGYSFNDNHINDIIINSLKANRKAQVFAFVYDKLPLDEGEKCNLDEIKCNYKYTVVKDSHYEKICKLSNQITILGFRTIIHKGEIYQIKMSNCPDSPDDSLPYFTYDLVEDPETKKEVCNGFGELKICDFKEMASFLKKMAGEFNEQQ